MKSLRKSVSLLIFLALLFTILPVNTMKVFAVAANWENVGSAGFSAGEAGYTSIAIDSSGKPYVVYKDGGNSDKATVKKYNGTSWETVGSAGFSAGAAQYTNIAIDSSGTPYVVYKDSNNGNKATVMKYNGTSWVTVGSAGFSAGRADSTSIAFDSSGTPYVVYMDYGNGYKATVKKYNGTSWETVGSAGFSAGIAASTRIAIDSSGAPYVVYGDYGNSYKATVKKYNGTSWETVGSVGFSAGMASYTDLAIDSSGTPYVVYVDDGNSAKATVMKYASAPAYTATASAASSGPAAGANNAITLTVKNSDGNTDATFSGAHNVTVSGYTAAPNGSYGSFNGTALTASPNTISVTFTSGVASPNLALNKAAAQTIAFSIAGVNTPATNTVSITPVPASVASMTLTQDITAPAANGGQFAQQPKVTLKDAYGNICTNNNTKVLTASKKDAGSWTLTGTTTATVSAGVATFTNLGTTNAAAVTGAKLAFDTTGLTQITSSSVNLPAAPPYTATASAATLTPATGANNAITLTVKDSLGNTKTTFSGAYNVTVSGYTAAPNGSYGNFNGTALTASPNTISVTFTSGVASPNLALNKAAVQTIAFSIAGVTTPATNSLNITPSAGTVSSMAISQNIAAPVSNGDPFAQQPVITLKDAYGNICTSDSTTQVTASKYGSGSWSLAGITTVTSSGGVVTFSDLSSINTTQINSASIAFDSPGLTSVVSSAVTLPPVILSSIAITTPATKLSYIVGDTLDLSGLVVTGTYSDTTTQVETVTAANVTGFNSAAPAANQVLTITIGGKTTSYTVNIVAAPVTLSSIAVTTPATKLSYTVGDALDFSGLVVTGTYSDTTTQVETVTAANVTGFNSSAPAANQVLTITIGGKTTSYMVNIVADPVTLSSIAITTPATKLSYTVGDTLNLSGLVVTGTYSDSSTQVETVTAANVTGFNSAAPAVGQVLTITIGGKTTTYTVNIVAASANQLLTSSNANVTVDNTAKTITYPMYTVDSTNFTLLANIKSVIAAASGYTYEIYKADGTTVATAMEVTDVLKVLQGGNIVETYTFAAYIKYGDVNGDGALNTADLTLLGRYILNSTSYPFEKDYGIKAADINKDNEVNSSDKLLLQRYLNNAQNYPIPLPTEFLYIPFG